MTGTRAEVVPKVELVQARTACDSGTLRNGLPDVTASLKHWFVCCPAFPSVECVADGLAELSLFESVARKRAELAEFRGGGKQCQYK